MAGRRLLVLVLHSIKMLKLLLENRGHYISNLLMKVACTGALLDVNTQANSPSLTSNLKGEDHSVLIVQI